MLADHVYPTFGYVPVVAIKPSTVREWHSTLARGDGKKIKDRPTTRAHAYGLLRTIMHSAVSDELIGANPCRVRGAGSAKRARKIRPASLPELEALTNAMPERYQLVILFAAWCALRFGELAELRRSDVDVKNGLVHVRRGVIRTKGERIIKGPKSEAGKRTVKIPPHLMPMVKDHLRDHVAGREGLLSRRQAIRPSTWSPARSTGCSTRPGKPPGVLTFGSTTCATQGPLWPPRRAPRWPN